MCVCVFRAQTLNKNKYVLEYYFWVGNINKGLKFVYPLSHDKDCYNLEVNCKWVNVGSNLARKYVFLTSEIQPFICEVLKQRGKYTVWREKTNKMQQLDVYYQLLSQHVSGIICPSSGEQRSCYCIWCVVLVLLDVVGSGCGALSCRMWALWRFLFNGRVHLTFRHLMSTIVDVPHR